MARRGNPNPSRRLTPDEREKGRIASAEGKKHTALERRVFREAFSAACLRKGLDPDDVIDTLVGKAIEMGMSSKDGNKDILDRLFGKAPQPLTGPDGEGAIQQEITLLPPRVAEGLRRKYRELQREVSREGDDPDLSH